MLSLPLPLQCVYQQVEEETDLSITQNLYFQSFHPDFTISVLSFAVGCREISGEIQCVCKSGYTGDRCER